MANLQFIASDIKKALSGVVSDLKEELRGVSNCFGEVEWAADHHDSDIQEP